MTYLLEAKDLTRTFYEGSIATPVLKGLSIALKEGVLTAITGKSGSGKSTLLHILGTLDSPTSGQLLFKGEDILKLTDNKKAQLRSHHLGFIYQFHHLLMDFSALENVQLPLLIAGLSPSQAKARAQEYLEKVGLSDKQNCRPGELSGGQRQRVAVARALSPQPDLILADEPTGSLDEENAAAVFSLFEGLVRKERRAVLMVTHDQSLASRCDRIFALENGSGAYIK